jgi:hypothetical protein
MNCDPWNKRLDDWLDQALAEYGAAEPRPGIEARTVAILRDRMRQRPWWQRWSGAVWVPTAALTFVLLLFVLLVHIDHKSAPDLAQKNDQELLIGVESLLKKEVPAALEPALVLTKEMAKKQ